MKAFIGKITFNLDDQNDINLFIKFLKTNGDDIDVGPFTATPNPITAMAGRNNRGDVAARNRRKAAAKKRKRAREKEERKRITKSHKAAYQQQLSIYFNPFLHQVTGVLRKTPVRFKSLAEAETFFIEKKRAREDFLRTNHPLLYRQDEHIIKFNVCLEQLNQISCDYLHYRPRYTEQWYNGVKAAERGDTYLRTCSPDKAHIHHLAFSPYGFTPTYSDLYFKYLKQSVTGISVGQIVYKSTSYLVCLESRLRRELEYRLNGLEKNHEIHEEYGQWDIEKEAIIKGFSRRCKDIADTFDSAYKTQAPRTIIPILEQALKDEILRIETKYNNARVSQLISTF